MIGYLSEFGLANISYVDWMKHTFPILVIEIPIAALILWFTFKPKQKSLDSAIRKIKVEVANEGKLSDNQWISIFIFLFIFFCWVFLSPLLGLGIIALFGVFLYLSFGLIDWKEISGSTNWGVILLFGSAISLGIQMKETGAAFWVAETAISNLEYVFKDLFIVRWFISVMFTGLLTNLISSAATVAVLGPIVLDMGGDPIIMGIATSIASSFSYLTLVASPTCMIIYSTGIISSRDYLKAGWKLFLISNIILIVVSYFYWPLLI